MDPNIKALIDAMQKQQPQFQQQNADLQKQFISLFEATQSDSAAPIPVAVAIPKFEAYDKSKEKWNQYLQRFNQHINVYWVVDDSQKQAHLLSWVGAETYDLLSNLIGAEDITSKSFTELSEKLNEHFADTIHVQASRFEFSQCKMKTDPSYVDWAAELCGLARHCAFTCKSTGCGTSYVNEQIRDLTIEEMPHGDVSRQCLLDADPSLNDVLKNAAAFIKTTETDKILKRETTSPAIENTLICKATKVLGHPPPLPVSTHLKAYRQSELQIKGYCSVSVKVGDVEEQNLKLIVVNTTQGSNLFGLDLSDKLDLSQQGLAILTQGSCDVTCTVTGNNPIGLRNKIAALFSKYSDVFKAGLGGCKKLKVPVRLKPGSTPSFSKPRVVPFSRCQAVKEALDRLVKAGVLENVEFSDYAAPIVAVSKPNERVRICGDFRMLNQEISIDQHPLPSHEELLEKLRGGVHFSKIDLADAYLQLELDDNAKKLCVINTQCGLFCYNRMCFGLASSQAQFLQCMDSMIAHLPGVAAYLDDLIVTDSSKSEHWCNLDKLLARLQEYGLHIQREKCEFFKNAVDYLGHIIDKNGKTPSTSQSSPLYKFIRENVEFDWTDECDKAFHVLKESVIKATELTNFDQKKNIPVLTAQRLQRWALTLMAYQYDIGYKPAAQHGNADGLSRLPIGADPKFYHDEEKESIEVSHTIQQKLNHGPLDDEAVKQETMEDTSLPIVK
ncbi:uncharacterized protein [Watersipora subatra]|uniref:uncharacterized protein n=1 Tax=Watersipora subatra TaxID=2589382 RepID=UPI00355BC2F5